MHNESMKKLLTFALFLLLSTSAMAQKQMSEQDYLDYVGNTIVANKCGLTGQLSPDKAAWVKLGLEKTLSLYFYDKDKMLALMEKLDKEEVLPRHCNRIAMQIAEGQLKEQRAQPAPPAVVVQPQNNVTRFTNCSTYFGNTFCTTY